MAKNNLNFIFSIFLSLSAVIISILPDIYRLAVIPANTTFPLIHNNAQDYFYYLSLTQQGFEGQWFLTTYMTPERFPRAFAQTFFALLGQVSRITHISNVWLYFISRIVLGFTLLITCVYLAKKLYTPAILSFDISLACLFTAFGTGFWTATANPVKIVSYLSFWTRLNPILRTTYLPHHLFSTIFGLLSIILLAQAINRNSIKVAIISGLLALASSFVYFATMINIIGGFIIAFFIHGVSEMVKKIKEKRQKSIVTLPYLFFRNRKSLPSLFIYFSLSSISLIYLLYLSRTTFPWSTYDKVGQQGFTFHIFFWHYIGALGPLFFLTLLGIPLLFTSDSLLGLILLGWTIFPFIGIFFLSEIFPQYGNVYFLEATSYIPIGILAVFGIIKLKSWLRKYQTLTNIFILLIIVYFIPPVVSSLQRELKTFPTNYYNKYIPNQIFDGINWLSGNTKKEEVVLSGGFFGNIIPAYTHNRVVYGHPANTYDSAQKSTDVNLFFSQKDPEIALDILQKYNVSYVFFSLDTDSPNDDYTNLLKLEKVFENDKVKIYRTDRELRIMN